jgi:hypothetical protein
MREFRRTFDVDSLTNQLNDAPVVVELFQRWVLPGQESGLDGLRLAVRDGYLNFYVAGQSVANIACAANRPLRLTIHKKYHGGIEQGTSGPAGMKTLMGADLRDPNPAALVDRWIETAASYCSAEKLFVDLLVAGNAGVLDLEMALPGEPALAAAGQRLTSPRMDLVIVRSEDAGTPVLNFWEAKCADNPELRARADIDIRGEKGARVVRQLDRYMRWFAAERRVDQVRCAYQQAAGVMLQLAQCFGKLDSSPPAIALWRTLTGHTPQLVVRPGIVVGNFDPRGRGKHPSEPMESRKRSFAGTHRQRLEEQGLTVTEIDEPADAHIPLPALFDGEIRARGPL